MDDYARGFDEGFEEGHRDGMAEGYKQGKIDTLEKLFKKINRIFSNSDMFSPCLILLIVVQYFLC